MHAAHAAGRRLRPVWLVALPLVLLAAPASPQSAATQEQLMREYVEAFRAHELVPVLIPMGHEVGDVLDRLGMEFIRRRDECFAGLAPREQPSRLPNIELGALAAIRLGLGLDRLGEADLRAVGSSRFILRFENVTLETVSQGQLQQAVRAEACPDVARLVNKDPQALAQTSFLVGTLIRARSVVRIERDRQGGGNVSTSWLTAFAERFGLRLRLSGGTTLEAARTVEFGSDAVLPVGFRPALIRVQPGEPGYRSGSQAAAPAIVEFNLADPASREALDGWITRQADSTLPGAR